MTSLRKGGQRCGWELREGVLAKRATSTERGRHGDQAPADLAPEGGPRQTTSAILNRPSATVGTPEAMHPINFKNIFYIILAGVAQWIECPPENQRVAGSIPSQGTCLGCRLGPQ